MAFENIAQPETVEARRALAIRSRDEFELPMTFLIDGMDDASRALFSDLPSPAFVLDRDGRIADKLPWADPETLAETLRASLVIEKVRAPKGFSPRSLVTKPSGGSRADQ